MDIQKNSNEYIENLKYSATDAPTKPGVYLMKNEDGEIIYAGKAKNLRNRLKTYFFGEKDAKTAVLMRHVRSLETIIVTNEYDALLLENTLIKQHSPKYNISLKDGKTYPLIRITNEDFPRVFRTRRIINDKSLYFGPFADLQSVNSMMAVIDKLFPLRKCKTLKKNGPCMYYHIGRCLAPCCGKINKEEYSRHVQRVQKLLGGETESLIIDLTAKMHKEAKALRFEEASILRNAVNAIENLAGENSKVEDLNPENRDYIAWANEGIHGVFTVFSMRGGKMTGRDLFRTRSAADETESLELFITTYYDSSRPPPSKIYFQGFLTASRTNKEEEKEASLHPNLWFNENNVLINWFKEKFGYAPELLTANEKHHSAILAMAGHNAIEEMRKISKERGAGPALEELAKVLDLRQIPQRIEGYDISHLDGKHPVASLISFKNGVPDKKNYRYFKLRSVIGKIDDYAAMREVVKRRYSRLIKEGTELPDLILVDGGIGQVNAAKEVLDYLGLDCAVAGLAKREEELWLPSSSSKPAKNPIVLSPQSDALKTLQFVRDECHRFANNFNRRLRSKELFFSILESVENIGAKKAAAIIKTYESIKNIAAANPAQMAKKCGISKNTANAVVERAKLALGAAHTQVMET